MLNSGSISTLSCDVTVSLSEQLVHASSHRCHTVSRYASGKMRHASQESKEEERSIHVDL